MNKNIENLFNKQEDLIENLSKKIINNLLEAINKNGKASLLVSGGSTPKPLFEKLSLYDIAWENINIALVDERWVDISHKDSNEQLVKSFLLTNFAKKANFISMYQKNIDIENAQKSCSDIYKNELFPFDVIILGMGADGHTASLFPNNEKLTESFESKDTLCICMTPSDAPHNRMSLTKKAILSANNIYLHFEGKEKQDVYKKVKDGVSVYDMPVASIINQDEKKVEVYYL